VLRQFLCSDPKAGSTLVASRSQVYCDSQSEACILKSTLNVLMRYVCDVSDMHRVCHVCAVRAVSRSLRVIAPDLCGRANCKRHGNWAQPMWPFPRLRWLVIVSAMHVLCTLWKYNYLGCCNGTVYAWINKGAHSSLVLSNYYSICDAKVV